MTTQRKRNRFLNARRNNALRTAAIERRSKRTGTIWRTLATYSQAFGRTPYRSLSPRPNLNRVLLAAHSRDTHGHAAAACK